MGKGKEFRTTINIGGDIDPSVRAAIESMADRLEMLGAMVVLERTMPSTSKTTF